MALAACGGTQQWPEEPENRTYGGSAIDPIWRGGDRAAPPAPAEASPGAADGAPATTTLTAGGGDLYRNTYYDFPREASGAQSATIYDAACVPLARVTPTFHDQLCVQGSGRLTDGQTVSFARRDCGCAAICPRTGQKICYERLDPTRFPHGRGAAGGPITPLYTVAVDVSVIPLGTRLFVPELAGMPRTDGSSHDGCFVAEDRGLKVVGRHLDIFTGDPAVTVQWNARYPSNRGVHVMLGDPRCVKR
jgi:3D (Asp-Asp-Asp) domain-containing protein